MDMEWTWLGSKFRSWLPGYIVVSSRALWWIVSSASDQCCGIDIEVTVWMKKAQSQLESYQGGNQKVFFHATSGITGSHPLLCLRES